MKKEEVIARKKNAVVIKFNDDPSKGTVGYYGELYEKGIHTGNTCVHGDTELAISTVLDGAKLFFGDKKYEIVR